jgi:hypothetical protein
VDIEGSSTGLLFWTDLAIAFFSAFGNASIAGVSGYMGSCYPAIHDSHRRNTRATRPQRSSHRNACQGPSRPLRAGFLPFWCGPLALPVPFGGRYRTRTDDLLVVNQLL